MATCGVSGWPRRQHTALRAGPAFLPRMSDSCHRPRPGSLLKAVAGVSPEGVPGSRMSPMLRVTELNCKQQAPHTVPAGCEQCLSPRARTPARCLLPLPELQQKQIRGEPKTQDTPCTRPHTHTHAPNTHAPSTHTSSHTHKHRAHTLAHIRIIHTLAQTHASIVHTLTQTHKHHAHTNTDTQASCTCNGTETHTQALCTH